MRGFPKPALLVVCSTFRYFFHGLSDRPKQQHESLNFGTQYKGRGSASVTNVAKKI